MFLVLLISCQSDDEEISVEEMEQRQLEVMFDEGIAPLLVNFQNSIANLSKSLNTFSNDRTSESLKTLQQDWIEAKYYAVKYEIYDIHNFLRRSGLEKTALDTVFLTVSLIVGVLILGLGTPFSLR